MGWLRYALLVGSLVFSLLALTANDREAAQAELEQSRKLRADLLEVVEVFSGDVLYFTTSEQFNELDPEARRRFLAWCYRTVPYMRSLCFDKVPEVSLFDLGIMATWMKRYLELEEAQTAFGKARLEFLEYVDRLDRRVNRLMKKRMSAEDYTQLQQELHQWIDQNPKAMRMRYQIASDLAIEHLDLEEDEVGLSVEQRLLGDLKSRGGGLFTGKLESTIQSTNLQVNEIELEMERIADHLEWMPVYTSWVMQMMALDYLESGPLVDELEQLHELKAIRLQLEELTQKLAPLAELGAFQPRIDKSLEHLDQLESHMTTIEDTFVKHERRVGDAAEALNRIAIVLTDRNVLITLAIIIGGSMGVAFILCIAVYRTFLVVARAKKGRDSAS